MSGAKKIEPVFEDPLNAKIQRKFDIVFTPVVPQKAKIPNENNSSVFNDDIDFNTCLLYTSPSPRDAQLSRMPSSA